MPAWAWLVVGVALLLAPKLIFAAGASWLDWRDRGENSDGLVGAYAGEERNWARGWVQAAAKSGATEWPLLDETDAVVLGPTVDWYEGVLGWGPVSPAALSLSGETLSGHVVVVGDTGSGKSTLLRRVSSAAALRRNEGLTIYVDCKGGPKSAGEGVEWVKGLVSSGVDPERVGVWPLVRLDMWAMNVEDLVSTLAGMIPDAHPHFDALREAAVRLAVTGGAAPPASAAEFLARLDARALRGMWQGDPVWRSIADTLCSPVGMQPAPIEDVRIKYATLFAELGPQIDGGGSTLADFDALWCSVPGTRRPEVARAVAGALVALVVDYLSRENADGRPVTLVVDEYSAVSGGRGSLVNLVERLRSLGGSVVAAAQSWEGLGASDAERARLVAGCSGGVLLLRSQHPEPLLRFAGRVRRLDVSETDSMEGDRTTSRLVATPVADPDRVRALFPGQVVHLRGGRAVWAQVVAVGGPVRSPAEVARAWSVRRIVRPAAAVGGFAGVLGWAWVGPPWAVPAVLGVAGTTCLIMARVRMGRARAELGPAGHYRRSDVVPVGARSSPSEW